MDNTVINLIKKYTIASITIIFVVSIGVFLSNNTLYIINSSQTFSVKAIDNNDKENNLSSIFSVYAIPKGINSLKFESSTEANIPEQGIIKPLTKSDHGLGVRKINLEFTNQYELVTNGRENYGCAQGKYPNILDYTCSTADKLLSYDASKPLDYGQYILLPPTIIDSYISSTPTTERTLGVEPYKDGLLSLEAKNENNDDPPLTEASLRYTDQFGISTNFDLPNSFGSFNSGDYQLLTDSSGTENFIIMNTKSGEAMVYSSTKSKPKTIKISENSSQFVGDICNLNNSILACYGGPLSDHVHNEEEASEYRDLKDGKVTLFDTISTNKLSEHKISKQDTMMDLCLDKYKRIYTIYEDGTLNVLTGEGDSIASNSILKADALSCGNNVHFTNSDKLYSIHEDGSAHLAYSSELIKIDSVQMHKNNVFVSGHYSTTPGTRFSFLAKPKSDPYTKQRLSDMVASVVEKHKNDVVFEVRFTENSIDYIVSKNFTPNGKVVDQDGIDKLLESTELFKTGITPTIYSVPND